jgi:hypothetical protein
VGSTDFCKAHGGGKRCKEAGCDKSAAGSTDFCKAPGGGKRCKEAGCDKSARHGATDFCIAHGGGKRCKEAGCDKSARGATDFCKAHGGGKRCKEAGCDKSAHGATDFCIAHGGGKRCEEEGCDKSAQGATDFCIAHGGGIRCVVCSDVSVHFKGGACYKCRCGTSLKQWESYTTKWLNKMGWPWSYSDQELPCAREMSTRNSSCIKRPDYVFVFETHVVILEVDELYHRHYASACEVDRMGKLKDLVKLPLHIVRFNPAKGRYVKLKKLLAQLFSDPTGAQNPAGVLVHFVGYPEERIWELNQEEEFCYEFETFSCI